MNYPSFIPYDDYKEYPVPKMQKRARSFYQLMKRRRTVRDFSSRPVPKAVIEDCLRTAGTAPNGANKQPWQFVAVSDPGIKREIRLAAEKEEKEFYEHRASGEWLKDLQPLGTGSDKPFLEDAPYLIAIFAERFKLGEDEKKHLNYYVKESVGIATGLLIAAIHNAGLASLTHTPSPMDFLNDILDRPDNERAFLLLVVGYPKDGVKVPAIDKKSLNEIATFV